MNNVPEPFMLLTEEQADSLIAAITSASYEEYCIRCALAGVEPIASSASFGLNHAAKGNSQ